MPKDKQAKVLKAEQAHIDFMLRKVERARREDTHVVSIKAHGSEQMALLLERSDYLSWLITKKLADKEATVGDILEMKEVLESRSLVIAAMDDCNRRLASFLGMPHITPTRTIPRQLQPGAGHARKHVRKKKGPKPEMVVPE